MHWPVALKEPERVLDDLANWTDINVITVSNTCWGWRREGAPLILPSIDAFQGPGPPKVTDDEYASMMSFLSLAKDKGFKVTSNICPLHPSFTDLDKLRMVDITDRNAKEDASILHGCPNNPEVLQWGETMIRETVATWSTLDSVHLNHVEYPVWPRHGLKGMFLCFCNHCRDKAEAQGIDFEKMKQEVEAFYLFLASSTEKLKHHFANTPDGILNFLMERPQLAIWIKFRMNALTAFIKKITEGCRAAAKDHQPDLKIGLEFFLPSVSRLFGTAYDEIYTLYDWVAPKFPEYFTGSIIPLAVDQITNESKRGDVTVLRKGIHELCDLGPGPEVYQPSYPKEEDMYYSDTFDLSTIGRQMKHLQSLQGKIPMYPYVWLYNHDLNSLKEKILCLRENGFDGYCLWLWEPDLTTDAIQKAKGVY